MDRPDLEGQIAAARAYQTLHVPALFQEWVDPVLDAAEVAPGLRVLDVACGTGILARGALRRVGAHGSVVGLDPNQGMLEVAREMEASIDWRAGTAGALPFEDGAFDRVVSQFGIMFFPDRLVAVREMLRVLEPGGALAVAVWDELERSPGYAREVDLLERTAGTRAADALRAPFAMGDAGTLTSLFREAGVDNAEVRTADGKARFPSVRSMVEADLRGWLPVMGVELPEDEIERILALAEEELAAFVGPDGVVAFPSPAHIVTGRKPDRGRARP